MTDTTQAPERIFLQDAGDYAATAEFEVTWCVEAQDENDTEYVRADLLTAAEARVRESALDALAAYGQAADAHTAQLAAEAKLAVAVEGLKEAIEIVHKAYVAATMEAVNAGPSHPLVKKYDAWRVRCMTVEAKARAILKEIDND